MVFLHKRHAGAAARLQSQICRHRGEAAQGGSVFRRLCRRAVAVLVMAVLPLVAQAGVAVASDTDPPSTPTGLAATVSAATVVLDWSASSDAHGVAWYEIHTSTTSGFSPSPATLLGYATDTTYTDSCVPEDTWFYRVIAVDVSEVPSAASAQASATVGASSNVVPPAQPAGVTASVSGSTVSLSWAAATDDAGIADYDIHASTTPDFTPDKETLVDVVTGTSYVDVDVPAGTWYYRVIAFDTSCNPSAASAAATAVVPDVTPPSAPTAVVANVSGATVTLSWGASSDDVGVLAYDVHRSATAGFAPTDATKVGSTPTTSFTEASTPGGTWYYRVVARDAAGNASMAASAEAVTVVPPLAAPMFPGAYVSDMQAELVWGPQPAAPVPGVEYVVTLQPGGRQYVTTGSMLTVTNLTNGVSYTYTVYARNSSGRSAEVTSRPFVPRDTDAPANPPSMSYSHDSDVGVNLSWWQPSDADLAGAIVRRLEGLTAPNQNEGVEVYRGRAVGAPDQGVLEGRTYTYAVWFYDEVPNYSSSTTTTLYGSVLSASPSARRVMYAGGVTHRAVLTRANSATAVGGQLVQLYARAPGTAPWLACSAYTSTSGTASCLTKPTRSTEYQWRFRGDGNRGRATSRAYVVGVRAKVSAKVSATTMARGARFTLAGSVAPKHAGQKVYLQRYSGGAWRSIASKYLSSTSTYSFRVSPRSTYSYRVVKPADRDHLRGLSRTHKVAVR